MKRNVQGIIFAGFAGILWGTYGTFVTSLSNIGFSESAIAVFAPISLILFFGISTLIRGAKLFIPTKRQLIIYIVCGIVGVMGTNLLYAAAMAQGLSVAIASVITFSNYFLVMIASRFLWKVKITKQKVFAGILVIGGIFLLLEAWTDISLPGLGLLFILFVTVTFALGYILTKFAFDNEGAHPDPFYFWINLIGFIATSFINPPWQVFGEVSTVYAAHGMIAILLLLGFFILPQIGCYFCLGRALQRIDAPLVVIMYALDPITAAILGFFLLHQTLDVVQIVGMLIIIGGLTWLQLSELKEMKRTESAVVDTVPNTPE